MSDWLNHVTISAPRNATTTHTVTPSSGTVAAGTLFAPTAGRLLVVLAYGAVTSTTPTGWTLPAGGFASNNGGLYVWWITAAGNDSLTTTHNGTNYPLAFDFYEFAAGSVFASSVSSINNASAGAGPTLSGLTGTHWIAGVLGAGAGASSGVTAASTTWSAGTKDVDSFVAPSGTDGYLYSLAEFNADASASKSTAATWTATSGPLSPAERLVFAVTVAAGVTYPSRPRVARYPTMRAAVI